MADQDRKDLDPVISAMADTGRQVQIRAELRETLGAGEEIIGVFPEWRKARRPVLKMGTLPQSSTDKPKSKALHPKSPICPKHQTLN